MLDIGNTCRDDKLYHSFDVGSIDYDYSNNSITEKHHEKICFEQSETLSEDERDKVDLLSDMFSIGDLDILQDDHLKSSIYTSESKNYPLIYKGKNNLFYFEPIKQSDFERTIGTDFKKPVLKLRRFVSEDEKIKSQAIRNTRKKPVVKKKVKKVVVEKKKDYNYLYITMFVIFLVIVIGIFISINA